jgi:hypothetical protein
MKLTKFLLPAALVILLACNHSADKPVSNNITKTTVTVNGRKDSVLNNQEKNYGNATVADPCVKCLLAIIQQSSDYKTATAKASAKSIIYAFDWITSKTPQQINGGQINSGMRVSVMQKTGDQKDNLAIFLYNNENSKLYNKEAKTATDTISIDSISKKRIRNSCFWGVASSK